MVIEKKIILIFGKRGSGKSYLARKLMEIELRSVIFDTMSEYENGVVFGAENYDELLEFWRKVYQGRFRIIYRPLQPAAEIDGICELVYNLGNCCFLVEEIDC